MLIIDYFGSFSDTLQHGDWRLHHNENLFISTFWWLFREITAVPHGQLHGAPSLGKNIHSYRKINIPQTILTPDYAQHKVMYHLIQHTYPSRHYFSTKWHTAFLLNVLACYFTGQFGFFPRSICLPHQQTSSLQQDSWPASVIHFWSLHNCPLKLHSILAVCLRVNTASLTVLCMHDWMKISAPPTVITVCVCLRVCVCKLDFM